MSILPIPHMRYRWKFPSLLPACLLVIYATGAIVLDFFHQAFHDHSTTGHTIVLETLPLYPASHVNSSHNDRPVLHFAHTVKCKFSHVVFCVNLLSSDGSIKIASLSAHASLYAYTTTSRCYAHQHTHLLRGPPVA